MRRIIFNFSTIVYLNYSIVFSDFYNYGQMNLIQTTTGNNENTLYHISKQQLMSISNITTHSFTIRLNLSAFHLCLPCTEIDDITTIKNFIILHIYLFHHCTTHCLTCITNFIISTDYPTRIIGNTIDKIFNTKILLLEYFNQWLQRHHLVCENPNPEKQITNRPIYATTTATTPNVSNIKLLKTFNDTFTIVFQSLILVIVKKTNFIHLNNTRQ